MIAITLKNIDIGGCAIHFLESGDPAGPPVILLHGMKFQAQTWRELGTLDLLTEMGAHVLAVDMPGFGQSPVNELAPVMVLQRITPAIVSKDTSPLFPETRWAKRAKQRAPFPHISASPPSLL